MPVNGGLLNEPWVLEFSRELEQDEFKSTLGDSCTQQQGAGKLRPLVGIMVGETNKISFYRGRRFTSGDVFVSHEFTPPLTSYGVSNAPVRSNLFNEMCNILSAQARQVAGTVISYDIRFPLVPYVTCPSVDVTGENPEETYFPVSINDVRKYWSQALSNHKSQEHRSYYIQFEKNEIKEHGRCAVTICRNCLDYVSCMIHLQVAEKLVARKHEPFSENPKRSRAIANEFGYGTFSGTPRQFKGATDSDYRFPSKNK